MHHSVYYLYTFVLTCFTGMSAKEAENKATIDKLETCLKELVTEKEALEKRIAELSETKSEGGAVTNLVGDDDVGGEKDALISRLEAEHRDFQEVFNVEKGKGLYSLEVAPRMPNLNAVLNLIHYSAYFSNFH